MSEWLKMLSQNLIFSRYCVTPACFFEGCMGIFHIYMKYDYECARVPESTEVCFTSL